MEDQSVSLDLNPKGSSEICICSSVMWAYEELNGCELKPGWFVRELTLARNDESHIFNEGCGRGVYVKKIADGSMEFDYEHGTLRIITGDTHATHSLKAVVGNVK